MSCPPKLPCWGRVKNLALPVGSGSRDDTSPQNGSCRATLVALWLPLKRRELRDSGSHIATFVIVR